MASAAGMTTVSSTRRARLAAIRIVAVRLRSTPSGVERPVGGDGEGLEGRLQAQRRRAGGRFAQGADDGGEGVVGLATGDLLLQDRGQQRLEDRPGARDPQAGVVVVGSPTSPVGRTPPASRAPPAAQARPQDTTPPPAPTRRDPDPASFRRVAGRGRPLRGPGSPATSSTPVDQVGAWSPGPAATAPGSAAGRPADAVRTTVSSGRCTAVIARILAPSRQPRPWPLGPDPG